jgi:hypothetical protein
MRQGSQAPARSQNPPFSSHRQFKVSVSKQIRSGKAGLRNVMTHENLSWRQPIALIQLGLFAKVRISIGKRRCGQKIFLIDAKSPI